MSEFTLKIAADRTGEAAHIQFNADDAAGALIIARREAGSRTAELWEGERKLCTIRISSVERDG